MHFLPMWLTPEERAAYVEGGGAAARAMIAARSPIVPPWESVMPDYAREPTLRAYQWKRGFALMWNMVRVNRKWPDWTEMRLVFTPPKGEEDRP